MSGADELPALRDRFRTIIREELALACFAEDSDGDFQFNYERNGFILLFHANDPSFVWLRNVREMKQLEELELSRADACINEVNRKCKAVKLWRGRYDDDRGFFVCASISLFADDPTSVTADTFERYLGLIAFGQRDFRQLYESDEIKPEVSNTQVPASRTH